MKSLFERALARPYYYSALLFAVIAAAALLWWLFCPQANENTVTTPSTIVTHSSIAPLPAHPEVASATTAPSEITTTEPTATAPTPVAVNTPLSTEPALAEEELDRLNDENHRLKERKAQLAQQLEISNKLLTMKEQQLKTLEKHSQ